MYKYILNVLLFINVRHLSRLNDKLHLTFVKLSSFSFFRERPGLISSPKGRYYACICSTGSSTLSADHFR